LCHVNSFVEHKLRSPDTRFSRMRGHRNRLDWKLGRSPQLGKDVGFNSIEVQILVQGVPQIAIFACGSQIR
jgi:hypothetical protein